MSGLANGAKFLLQEARQGRLKGRYQALSTQLVVPAEYETAIAAALGEYLDAVVVEGGTDPEDALLMLSRADKGRAVLAAGRLDARPGSAGSAGRSRLYWRCVAAW